MTGPASPEALHEHGVVHEAQDFFDLQAEHQHQHAHGGFEQGMDVAHGMEGHVCGPQCQHSMEQSNAISNDLFAEVAGDHVCGPHCEIHAQAANSLSDRMFAEVAKPDAVNIFSATKTEVDSAKAARVAEHLHHSHDSEPHVCHANCEHNQASANLQAELLFNTSATTEEQGVDPVTPQITEQMAIVEITNRIQQDERERLEMLAQAQTAEQSDRVVFDAEPSLADAPNHTAGQEAGTQDAPSPDTIVTEERFEPSYEARPSIDSEAVVVDLQPLSLDETPVEVNLEIAMEDGGFTEEAQFILTEDGAEEIDTDESEPYEWTDSIVLPVPLTSGDVAPDPQAAFMVASSDQYPDVRTVDAVLEANAAPLETVLALDHTAEAVSQAVAEFVEHTELQPSPELDEALHDIIQYVESVINVSSDQEIDSGLMLAKIETLADALGIDTPRLRELLGIAETDALEINQQAYEILRGLKKSISMEFSWEFIQSTSTGVSDDASRARRSLGQFIVAVLASNYAKAGQLLRA